MWPSNFHIFGKSLPHDYFELFMTAYWVSFLPDVLRISHHPPVTNALWLCVLCFLLSSSFSVSDGSQHIPSASLDIAVPNLLLIPLLVLNCLLEYLFVFSLPRPHCVTQEALTSQKYSCSKHLNVRIIRTTP